MTAPHGRASLAYTPGRWVAITSAASGDAVALLADLDPAAPGVAACWAAAEAGAGVDAMLGVILREGLRSVPSFAIAGRSADGMRVLVSGKARAEITGADGAATVLDAAAAPTWLERTLPGAAGVRLLAGPQEPGPRLALHGGVVLAGTVDVGSVAAAAVVSPTADTRTGVPSPPAATPTPPAAPPPAAPPAPSTDTMQPQAPPPARQPGDSGLIESVPWLASRPPPTAAQAPVGPPTPVDQQAPSPAVHQPMDRGGNRTGPMVLAVVCPNRHLGPPYAGVCRVCGAQVAQQDPFSVPRPVLGVLNISTGAMVPLDRDVVLGRAPSAGDVDRAARPHLVQLASPGNDISRNHVRIGLEGWHVLVTDLGSTNGTVVTLPGQQPVRLRAHDAFTIVPGTIVNIADEVNVRFEIQQ